MSQRIKTNSFVIQKQVKTPHISASDVYEKVIYDAVRRDNKAKNKQKKQESEDTDNLLRRKSMLSKSEMQMLNVLIPKDKRKENIKRVLQEHEDLSEDICK